MACPKHQIKQGKEAGGNSIGTQRVQVLGQCVSKAVRGSRASGECDKPNQSH